MPDWLQPELIWFLLGIALILLEFILPGVIIVFFGIGAVLTALLSWLGLLPSITAQLVFFCVCSPVLLFTLRRYLGNFFRGDVTDRNRFSGGGEYIGRTARAASLIEPGSPDGRIRFEGTDWKAVSAELIEEGEVVEIVAKSNITFTVRKPAGGREAD